jgi:selenide,water dikinase
MARLTTMARGGGCGCKLGKSALAEALALMPAPPPDPRVLAGFEGADDAAAYLVREDLAVIASVDFFTPIVDDPATFGAIAATNALSDLHATGATPAFALAVAAHPADGDPDDLAAIMRGGAEAALADGCPVLGGHTIDDPEPKYGLAAIGTAHPDHLLSNAAGRPGDALVLTKPLGVGLITTARMQGRGDDASMEAATASMLTSNAAAAAAAREVGVRCATDVTGFGLLGHLAELTAASDLAAEVEAGALPALPGARDLAAAGVTTGGAARNRAFAEGLADLAPAIPPDLAELLFDPQTSGGLLLAVPPGAADALDAALAARHVPGARIGRLTRGPAGTIAVTP